MSIQADMTVGVTPAPSTHVLSTGRLDLEIDGARRDPGELFRVAERVNPRRSFLFVSRVLGRHLPVAPSVKRAAVEDLAALAAAEVDSGPVLVMGYAETAVALGAAVAREMRRHLPSRDLLYLPTTRHPVPGREWLTFEEGHSHATDHHIMAPDPHPAIAMRAPAGRTLVLVDDETTTGNTFAGLSGVLTAAGVEISRIVLVTLTDWSRGHAPGVVASGTGVDDVRSVSLLDGCWSWERDPEAALPDIPGSDVPVRPAWTAPDDMRSLHRTPRLGLPRDRRPDLESLHDAGLPRVRSGESVLVIGTGEHVWTPFMVAEEFERRGHPTGFLATTRSPILEGDVIRRKAAFADHFGLGLPMYLHNVDPAAWDRIVLMTETGPEGICPRLRAYLGAGHVVDGSGTVTEMIRK